MIILLSEQIYDFNLDVALKEISEQRQAYVLRYKRELDRRLAVKAYLLLCEGLRNQYDIHENPRFDYSGNGKPTLADYPDIHFNISHCDKAILCAIDDRPIGVDIETVKAYDKELAQYTMNVQELAIIERSERPEIEFTRLWTMKEATFKWGGTGLTSQIQEVLTGCSRNLSTIISPNQDYIYSICR